MGSACGCGCEHLATSTLQSPTICYCRLQMWSLRQSIYGPHYRIILQYEANRDGGNDSEGSYGDDRVQS